MARGGGAFRSWAVPPFRAHPLRPPIHPAGWLSHPARELLSSLPVHPIHPSKASPFTTTRYVYVTVQSVDGAEQSSALRRALSHSPFKGGSFRQGFSISGHTWKLGKDVASGKKRERSSTGTGRCTSLRWSSACTVQYRYSCMLHRPLCSHPIKVSMLFGEASLYLAMAHAARWFAGWEIGCARGLSMRSSTVQAI